MSARDADSPSSVPSIRSRAAVLTAFDCPLAVQERDTPLPGPGQALVEIAAAGVCGSDVHMWRGQDPRIRLPLVLGHEGVGRVAALGGPCRDLLGKELTPGDLVVWDRGVTCGRCYWCAIRKEPFLCPEREVYGIARDGCYATHLLLEADTKLLAVEQDIDPAALVSATCSGATAAHAAESACIRPGDAVAVLGPGPLGVWSVCFALAAGAGEVFVLGRPTSRQRLELCLEFGATDILVSADAGERQRWLAGRTQSRGADVVMECAGSAQAAQEAVALAAPGGTCCLVGVAVPVEPMQLRVFEHVVRRNVRIQGIWVNDTAHLFQAVRLATSGRFPLERLVTHRFPLAEATAALEAVENRQAMKAVIIPGG